jgi:flagellar basal-body rod protein FlgF
MDRMIFLAMSAARQMMNGQSAAAHNLANASTTAFKADFDSYRAMPMFGGGFASRVYAMAERPGFDLSSGSIESTGNELDVSVSSGGMIAVQAPDGSEAYTRAGDFKVDATGRLLTANDLPVLGNGGPLTIPPAEKVQIGVDGTVSIRSIGSQASTLATVDRVRLVKIDPNNLIKGEDGLFRTRDKTPAPVDASVVLTAGTLEHSNVNPINEMVRMIETARRYELAVKAMKTAEQNDTEGARVLRLS